VPCQITFDQNRWKTSTGQVLGLGKQRFVSTCEKAWIERQGPNPGADTLLPGRRSHDTAYSIGGFPGPMILALADTYLTEIEYFTKEPAQFCGASSFSVPKSP
jgi:hypothetical protein